MAYVQVPDPLLDVDKPIRSVDIKQMRDNQDDFDSRVSDLELRGLRTDQDIRDHFLSGTTISTVNWTTTLGGSGTATIVSEHSLQLDTTGGFSNSHGAVLTGTSSRLRIAKSHEYVAFMNARVKRTGGTGASLFFGWNDNALAASLGFASDVSDCVGVVLGTTHWQGRTSNGGSASTTSEFSTSTNWNTILIKFTCSATAGSRKAEFYLNGTLDTTLATDANIPTASLCPGVALRSTSSDGAYLVDFIEFGFLTVPTAA